MKNVRAVGGIAVTETGAERGTRGQVARLILELGPSTAATLGGRLGLTPAAIRRHLDTLLAEGLIETRTARTYGNRGRGRPARVFVITDAGRSEFEHAYDDLATNALRFLAETAGQEAVAEFARRQVADLESRYAPALAQTADLSERVRLLAQALSDDGYAASAVPAPAIGATRAPAQGPDRASAVSAARGSAQAPAQAPSRASGQAPARALGQAQAQAQAPAQAQAQAQAQRPAQAQTPAQAQAQAQGPAQAQTQVQGLGTVNGEQLCQHHCPVAHVAAEFPQLCEAETEAFGRLLGTPVQRLATIAHGDGICTTHVTGVPAGKHDTSSPVVAGDATNTESGGLLT